MNPYKSSYFERRQNAARASAKEIMPLMVNFIQPNSVLDVGCGTGTWLNVSSELGAQEVVGLDGPWIDDSALEIPSACFLEKDLQRPFRLGRRFDLVISLEVAEHLPEHCAVDFVGSLVTHGPVVLFSAAIPHQGGTQHLNEQWPDYWVRIFAQYGYVPIDCIRKRVWRNPNVVWWYAQNCLVYVQADSLSLYPRLESEWHSMDPAEFVVIHPHAFLFATDPRNWRLRSIARALQWKVLFALRGFGSRRNRSERAQ